MPKQTKTTKSDNKPPLLLFIGGIVLLAGLWVFAVEPLLDWRDKQRFVAAEEYLEEVYEEYIAPVSDTPLNDASYCNYTSEKYGEGDLSCSVIKKVQIPSENAFNAILEESKEISIIDNTELEDEGFFVIQKNLKSTFCIYEYDASQLNIQLSCSGSARAEHYNVR